MALALHVAEVRILKGLEHGLDDQAVKALTLCRFKPGFSRSSGRPVDVIYTLTVNFKLTN